MKFWPYMIYDKMDITSNQQVLKIALKKAQLFLVMLPNFLVVTFGVI